LLERKAAEEEAKKTEQSHGGTCIETPTGSSLGGAGGAEAGKGRPHILLAAFLLVLVRGFVSSLVFGAAGSPAAATIPEAGQTFLPPLAQSVQRGRQQ